MKLITKELEIEFAKTGRQDAPDPTAIAKFFDPCGSGTWYATEYDPNAKICFGYVTGLGFDEWGTFSIDELESVKCPPFNLPIERDLYFSPQPISKLIPEIATRLKQEALERVNKQDDPELER